MNGVNRHRKHIETLLRRTDQSMNLQSTAETYRLASLKEVRRGIKRRLRLHEFLGSSLVVSTFPQFSSSPVPVCFPFSGKEISR